MIFRACKARETADDAECNVWNADDADDADDGIRCRRVRDGVPMNAKSPGLIAELASSAMDPDIPAGRARNRFPAGEFADEFDDNLDYGRLRAEYRRLAAEQAALRRVSHRLRRIEQRTGRSLSRPKDLAELCLVFEVHRHRV